MKKLATSILAGGAFAVFLALPACAADTKNAWPAESLSGTISMVEPGQNVVVVNSDNVPFDMVITPKTHIMYNNQAVTLQNMSQYKNDNVTVRFIPEGRGDVAETIHING